MWIFKQFSTLHGTLVHYILINAWMTNAMHKTFVTSQLYNSSCHGMVWSAYCTTSVYVTWRSCVDVVNSSSDNNQLWISGHSWYFIGLYWLWLQLFECDQSNSVIARVMMVHLLWGRESFLYRNLYVFWWFGRNDSVNNEGIEIISHIWKLDA